MTTTLNELIALEGTPKEALDKLNPSDLTEGAAWVLLAHKLQRKPKPIEVLAVCRDPRPNAKLVGFYMVNQLVGLEYTYHDEYDGGGKKRVRKCVGRIRSFAEELAEAAAQVQVDNTDPVDLAIISAFLKPRAYAPRVHLVEREVKDAIVKAINQLGKEMGYNPTVQEVADRVSSNAATTQRYIELLKREGRVTHEGPRTLRVLSHGQQPQR